MRNLKIAVVLASMLTSAAAFAQNAMVQGEVKKIDAAADRKSVV